MMNDMAQSSELTYLFKPVENKVPCGGFNVVGGGVCDWERFYC